MVNMTHTWEEDGQKMSSVVMKTTEKKKEGPVGLIPPDQGLRFWAWCVTALPCLIIVQDERVWATECEVQCQLQWME